MRAFTLILFILFMATPHAWGMDFDYNLGPGSLDISTQSPGQSARFSAEPMVPQRIASGDLAIRLGATWANVWVKDSLYDLDYEILHSRLSMSYGVNRRLLVQAAVNNRKYFGGGLDSFIQGFHDLFGIEMGGRDKVPRNQVRYIFFDDDVNVIVNLNDAHRFNNSNIMAGASYILSPGSEYFPAVSLSAAVVWELESPCLDNSEPFDIAFGLGLSKRWSERWYTYHWFNYTHFGRNQLQYFYLSDDGVAVVNAIVWEKSPAISFILQCMYTEGLVENIRGLERPAHEAHIGIKWRMKKQQLLEFTLIENVINVKNSPDFGLHLAYLITLK